MKFFLHEKAFQEYLAAADWYEARTAGLIGRYAIRRRRKPKQLVAEIMSAIPGSGTSRTLGAIELL